MYMVYLLNIVSTITFLRISDWLFPHYILSIEYCNRTFVRTSCFSFLCIPLSYCMNFPNCNCLLVDRDRVKLSECSKSYHILLFRPSLSLIKLPMFLRCLLHRGCVMCTIVVCAAQEPSETRKSLSFQSLSV